VVDDRDPKQTLGPTKRIRIETLTGKKKGSEL
jgi:hypothetical protein